MALGQRIHVQEAGKGDKRWYTQKPDMQGGHEHKDLGTGKGGGLWDSTRTLTPGWEVRAGPEQTRSETAAGTPHFCLGTVLDSLGQTLGFILNDFSR